jgi:hypothetical protein
LPNFDALFYLMRQPALACKAAPTLGNGQRQYMKYALQCMQVTKE